MGFPSVAKAFLGLTGAALVFFGIAFLGAALALALQPRLGVAGSAAVTGLILLLPPCIWGVAAGFGRPEYPRRRRGRRRTLRRQNDGIEGRQHHGRPLAQKRFLQIFRRERPAAMAGVRRLRAFLNVRKWRILLKNSTLVVSCPA